MSDWGLLFCHPSDVPAVREAMGPFGFSLLSVVERPGLAGGSVYVADDVEGYLALSIGALSTAMEAARIGGVPLAEAVRSLARVLAL